MRFLIVEDQHDHALALTRAIKHNAAKFTMPVTGEPWQPEIEVVTRADDWIARNATEPKPDIVLLDLTLGDASPDQTLELIAEQKRANPRCQLIVLTGSEDRELRWKSLLAGADDFWTKHDFAACALAALTHSCIYAYIAKNRDIYAKS